MLNLYRRDRGLWRFIPAPLRVFGCIAFTAAIGVLITPPLLILATPPLIASWWLWRRNMRRLASQLHDKRWNELASYHLRQSKLNLMGTDSTRVPSEIKSRIYRAISDDEQGLATTLHINQAHPISFSEVEEISQDFKASPGGFSERMLLQTYGLLADGKRVADLRLITKNDATRIEIASGHRLFVLRNDDSGPIIDIK